ncbi:MAG TPA: patatin-like phospholipase family protein, partial [Patescibacteria group bacterium]|nr:patatin-like phospholipase family protein [Patescibacteria group bacterium]
MTPINKTRQKLGLALGGGGAKGLAHIGVLKTLKQEGITIDFLAGTSIGSLVGGYFAAHLEVETLEKKILEKSDWRTGLSIFDPTLRRGILKGKKIEHLVAEWIGTESFEELLVPFTVVTTDLKSGAVVRLHQGDVVKAIRASLSVPLVFQPVPYNGMLLADGGLSDPVPDDIVMDMGANKIISVNLDIGYFDDEYEKEKEMKLRDISLRTLNILRYHLAQYC